MKIFRKSISSIKCFNLILRIFGIQNGLFNFSTSSSNNSIITTSSTLDHLFKCIPLIIGLTFAFVYPTEASSIVSRTPLGKNGKKTVDYFIGYAYFDIKYLVTIIIYGLQFRNEQLIMIQQMKIQRIFQRLWKLNQRWCHQPHSVQMRSLRLQSLFHLCNHQHQPITLAALNVFSGWHLLKIFFAISIRCGASYLEYHYIFERLVPGIMHSMCTIWFFYPIIFIDLFVWHASISVQQQTKLFELLNETLDTITIDIRQRMLKTFDKCHSNNMETLIEIHDELRASIQTIQQLNVIQVNAAILNAFTNIIIEVREPI